MKFVLHNITKEPLTFSEMKVREYKEILKCIFGDKPSIESFVETIYDVLFVLGTKEKEFYKKLNIYQIFQILTELRIQVFGEECIVSILDGETKNNLYLDLVKLLKQLKNVIEIFEQSFVEDSGIRINFGIPSINRSMELTEEEYTMFVKSITAKNKTVDIEDNDAAKVLVDNLAPGLGLAVIEHCKTFAVNLLSLNFLEKYNTINHKLSYVPTIDNLIWYIKLYFSEPLDVFYDNVFFLAHYGKIDAGYIEECTPGEYIFFAKKLAATLKEKNAANEEQQMEQ